MGLKLSSKVSAYLNSAQFVKKYEHLQQPQISLHAKNTLETKSGLKLSKKASRKTKSAPFDQNIFMQKRDVTHNKSYLAQLFC